MLSPSPPSTDFDNFQKPKDTSLNIYTSSGSYTYYKLQKHIVVVALDSPVDKLKVSSYLRFIICFLYRYSKCLLSTCLTKEAIAVQIIITRTRYQKFYSFY